MTVESAPGSNPSAVPPAALALAVFAVDPHSVGGLCIRGGAGAARAAWLAALAHALADRCVRKMPASIDQARLLGGLDLSATLAAGTPVAERGLLAQVDGGALIVAMAERLSPLNAAHLAQALDDGVIRVQRETIASEFAARFGVVALDEGIDDEERPPPTLTERLALHIDLDRAAGGIDAWPQPTAIQAARALLPQVEVDTTLVEALAATALALGVASLRAALLALRVARIIAALEGRIRASTADCALAAQLVLGPRATRLPAPASDETRSESEPAPTQDAGDNPQTGASTSGDTVLAAALASVPPRLLAADAGAAPRAHSAAQAGKQGTQAKNGARGRPAGIRAQAPGLGRRLCVLETLRAAAPWQGLRGRGSGGPIQVRREDFRVTRHRPRGTTTTVFIVDASGSAALARLAEAKGAVEALLAECYVRRDRVALVSFRGRGAELLLPPTRSLVRAKRQLGGIPGGGGTPLATGIECALELASALLRRGDTPTLVFLTDGHANVSRAGIGGRERAEADALASARRVAASGCRTILIDSAARPQARAAALAQAMRARYVALPQRDPRRLSAAVRQS